MISPFPEPPYSSGKDKRPVLRVGPPWFNIRRDPSTKREAEKGACLLRGEEVSPNFFGKVAMTQNVIDVFLVVRANPAARICSKVTLYWKLSCKYVKNILNIFFPSLYILDRKSVV